MQQAIGQDILHIENDQEYLAAKKRCKQVVARISCTLACLAAALCILTSFVLTGQYKKVADIVYLAIILLLAIIHSGFFEKVRMRRWTRKKYGRNIYVK